MGMDHEQTDPQRQFQAAVSVIQGLPKNGSYRPSYEEMLRFYSYYKQATMGSCNIPRPGFWDPIGRYKWDAWNGLGAMTKDDAMAAYITEMKRVAQKVIDTIPVGETSEEMFKYFEPLYEVIRDMPRPPETFFQKKAEGKWDHVTQGEHVRSEAQRNGPLVMQGGETKEDIRSLITPYETPTLSTPSLNEKELEQDLETALYQCDTEWVSTSRWEEKLQKKVAAEEALTSVSQVSTPTLEDKFGEGAEYSQVTSDSESEVFCDSLEQMELGQNQLLNDSCSSHCSINHGRQYEAGSWERSHVKPTAGRDRLVEMQLRPHREMSDGFLFSKDVKEACIPGRGERHIGKGNWTREAVGEVKGQPELTAQVIATVHELQDDLRGISARLTRLEALTASQRSWWPLTASNRTLVFLLLWPFFVHWLIKKFQSRKR